MLPAQISSPLLFDYRADIRVRRKQNTLIFIGHFLDIAKKKFSSRVIIYLSQDKMAAYCLSKLSKKFMTCII